jgi:hypothetical protein
LMRENVAALKVMRALRTMRSSGVRVDWLSEVGLAVVLMMRIMRLSEMRPMMRVCGQNSSSGEFWWWWRWNSHKTSISTPVFRFIWEGFSSEGCCTKLFQ